MFDTIAFIGMWHHNTGSCSGRLGLEVLHSPVVLKARYLEVGLSYFPEWRNSIEALGTS